MPAPLVSRLERYTGQEATLGVRPEDLRIAASDDPGDLCFDVAIEVIERHIRPEELATFSECFVVGTAAEVTPVAEIGEYTFRPGNISLSLMDDYAKMVRRELVSA